MTLISVIMGVYNCRNTELLRKSVESIINQTETRWELIICDDGSTDETLDILLKLKEMDPRIKVISYPQNRGLAFALNECIKASSGRYLARQDDDDISKPDRFKRQLETFRENPGVSIVGTCAEVYDDSGIWGEYTVEQMPTKKSFFWTNPFAHPTVMIKKEAMLAVGNYRISKETRRCEDYDLFMRMYAAGKVGYNIQEKLYLYRIINDNKKYRPMKYRIDEAIVRYKGYKKMGVLFEGWMFIFKPIIIGLIPQRVFRIIRKSQY